MKRFFLIHIPKTAGTAVNDALSAALPSIVHIESKPEVLPKLRGETAERFVSGHILAPRALSFLNRPEWFVFTFLREPVEHLISHLKWCQHVATTPQFPKYDVATQLVCTRLAELDLSDIVGLSELLAELPQARKYFDNCQTRYLSGCMPQGLLDDSHLAIALKVANTLDFVGFSENLKEGMEVVRVATGLPKIEVARANEARTAKRPDLTDPKVLDWYRKTVALDASLYSQMRKSQETSPQLC